jgi:hypothetical protein
LSSGYNQFTDGSSESYIDFRLGPALGAGYIVVGTSNTGLFYANTDQVKIVATTISNSTTSGALVVAGGAGIGGNVTADIFNAVNNGNGTNFKVGDDVWLGDINIANTLGIKGQQDGTQGYIRFGNVSTNALGVSGSGPLTWGGALNVSGNLSARIIPRIGTVADAATITPAADTSDQYNVTALNQAATIAIPTGSPADGQKLSIRLKDNGTGRALTWTTSAGGYRVIGTTLPTTTTANKVTYVGCVYNAQDSFWDVVAVTTQA